MIVQKLEVELTREEIKPDELPPPDAPPPPPLLDAVALPQLPAPIAVAQPILAIAFAIPVEGPGQIVEANLASYALPVTTNATPAAPASPTQTLTYGQGEGKQPAPEYPRQAIREGQAGVVGVRLVVGNNGRVVSAEAVQPSPWPLLNDSAVNTVRHRWRFRPGTMRVYEVSIRFELTK